MLKVLRLFPMLVATFLINCTEPVVFKRFQATDYRIPITLGIIIILVLIALIITAYRKRTSEF